VQEENKILAGVLPHHEGEEQTEVLVEELVVVKQQTLRKLYQHLTSMKMKKSKFLTFLNKKRRHLA
jgi:hypoxanthine-guanine phosphoribosyltransferase